MLIPITTSADVRWFREGIIPEELMVWFKRGKAMHEDARQRYLYLPFTHARTVGFTLREGTLYIQSLQKSLGLHRFAANLKGHVQLWIRWSHKISEIDRDLRTLFENDRWANVCEQRRFRKFCLHQGKVSEVPGNDCIAQTACHVELTEIEVGAKKFWSFGIESFGHAEQVEETLNAVSTYCFSERQSPLKRALNCAQSRSYPEWILSVRPRPSQFPSKRDERMIGIGNQTASRTRKQLTEMRRESLEELECLAHKYDRYLSKDELGEIIGRKI